MWEIHTDEQMYQGFTKIWMINGAGSFVPAFVKSITKGRLVMKEMPKSIGEEIPPTVEIPHREFIGFLEAWGKLAWDKGWRPKDYIPNDATLRHLEDMRKIVSKKVGVEL